MHDDSIDNIYIIVNFESLLQIQLILFFYVFVLFYIVFESF